MGPQHGGFYTKLIFRVKLKIQFFYISEKGYVPFIKVFCSCGTAQVAQFGMSAFFTVLEGNVDIFGIVHAYTATVMVGDGVVHHHKGMGMESRAENSSRITSVAMRNIPQYLL